MALKQTFQALNDKLPESEQTMPALFVGHGNPMNAIEDNEFSRAWQTVGKALPKPNAILCVSAHWETRGTLVTGMDKPKTIHDFGGFPRELYACQYLAPGSPELARVTQATVKQVPVKLDDAWGLDHGTWSVVYCLFPNADVPVVQLSLDRMRPPEFHYALGKELRALRNRGVLIVGSGNIVQNLNTALWQEGAFEWAIEFDETAKPMIESGDHQALTLYEKLGQAAQLSIPANKHYLPLLYLLALQDQQDQIRFFNDRVTMGSVWIQ